MDTEDLRITVYDRCRRGQVPRIATLADDLSVTAEEVTAGLATLAAQRHLALGADGEITMAHPFTAVPLGFSVMGRDTLWWGGCAWDFFALPHLMPEQGPMLVATTCPACETAHAWQVDDREPPPGQQVAHFLVPTARMWDDVVHSVRSPSTGRHTNWWPERPVRTTARGFASHSGQGVRTRELSVRSCRESGVRQHRG